MMEFVSWNDDIPNIWKNKSHVPNHQPVIYLYFEATVINHNKYSMLPNLASSAAMKAVETHGYQA